MKNYQRDFISFAIASKVLKFGSFTLKSGRISPYFFNAGGFQTGGALAQLGSFYASCLLDSGLQYDVLFGPAYKGIPLRKEVKDHGEGGLIVGSPLTGKVLIVDDVITAGTAIRESMQIISSAGANLNGVLIALDRQERGAGSLSAIQEIQTAYGVPVVSIVTLSDVLEYLIQTRTYPESIPAIQSYIAQWGSL